MPTSRTSFFMALVPRWVFFFSTPPQQAFTSPPDLLAENRKKLCAARIPLYPKINSPLFFRMHLPSCPSGPCIPNHGSSFPALSSRQVASKFFLPIQERFPIHTPVAGKAGTLFVPGVTRRQSVNSPLPCWTGASEYSFYVLSNEILLYGVIIAESLFSNFFFLDSVTWILLFLPSLSL